MCLAIGVTLLLAVHGATTAAASAAVALAGAAVRGEALGRTRQLLVVARAFVLAHYGGPNNPSLGRASARRPVPGSVPASDVTAPEPRYVEPRPEEPASAGVPIVVITVVALVVGLGALELGGEGFVGSGSGRERGRREGGYGDDEKGYDENACLEFHFSCLFVFGER